MKNTKRKGFTIVELVIVIAVIAILAAVLIPTFASLINKANRSADIQAVHQMNTQLAIDEVDSNKTIVDVYAALEEGGMTAKDYHPLASDTYFFWVETLNRIVYTDKEYKVTFPEEYEGKKVDTVAGDKAYLSLSGEIEEVEPSISGTTATVDSAEKFYWLSNNFDKENITEIKLSNDINLMGANVAFTVEGGKSLTISADSAVTLTGLVSLDSKFTDPEVGKDYAAGLVAYVNGGASLTISNITIDHATVGGYEIGGVGALIGRIENTKGAAGGKVTISNCTVSNSVINGKNKVGALIGSIASSTDIEVCNVKSCTVNCSEGESGKAIGCTYQGTSDGSVKFSLNIDKKFSEWVTKDTTLNLVTTDGRNVVDYTQVDFTATNIPEGCQKVVYYVEKNETKGRMFANDAYMTYLMEAAPESSKVAGVEMKDNFKYIDTAATLNSDSMKVKILYFFK